MIALCLAPLVAQAILMVIDEGWFHRARGLPRRERLGHPIDTLSLAGCLMWLIALPHGDPGERTSPYALPGFLVLAVISTAVVIKDEAVHARQCSVGEHRLHAALYVLHPVVLAAFAALWWLGADGLLVGQLGVTLAFCAYQIIYWNLGWNPWRADGDDEDAAEAEAASTAWYADLGARWYAADDTPIALVRAEARARTPWIGDEIIRTLGPGPHRVLDLGCGAGFLANYLAGRGHRVTAIDASPESLRVARAHDDTATVRYELGDPCAKLPFADGSFDVVCAMDLLARVDDPERLIAEAGRVLAPGGMFVFHTFNRTWQAELIVVKGVPLFVRNAPRAVHVHRMFVTPDEVRDMCAAHRFEPPVLRGSRPRLGWPLWRMLLTGRVGDDFTFLSCPSTKLGYTGVARRDATACDRARDRRAMVPARLALRV
ncbi:MAG TPA: methyltransferase domain-containing protein [Kofleriaceae bacterium]|nr:methyltransferase domain-containing protein [Kofleriaceae bacterium]